MIVTLTLNPSVDRAYLLDKVRIGEVNRGNESSVDAGGKGINISRALHSFGTSTLAVFPYGGNAGRLVVSMLETLGVACAPIEIQGETRTNITVNSSSGNSENDAVTTKINVSGPDLGEEDVEIVIQNLVARVKQGDVVVASGSLPPGVRPDAYVHVGARVKSVGGQFVLDTSGGALEAVLDNRDLSSVNLIKPNLEELEQACNRKLATFSDVVDVIAAYRERGLGAALVTLGGAGAVLVDSTGVYHGRGPRIAVRSTVGAGDMALAGFLQAQGDSATKLRAAIAWGSAATQQQGTITPSPSQVDYAGIQVVKNPPLNELIQKN